MVGCSSLARRCVTSEMVGCSALARRCVATQRRHSTAPMTLYHCVGARSLRVLWALKELGMSEYELVTMPFPPRAHYRPFLALNPLGTIPLLVHGDAKLTESCAGAVYAAEAVAPDGPLLVRPAEPDYASFLNWNYHADATLTFPQTLVLRYRDFARRRRPRARFRDDHDLHVGAAQEPRRRGGRLRQVVPRAPAPAGRGARGPPRLPLRGPVHGRGRERRLRALPRPRDRPRGRLRAPDRGLPRPPRRPARVPGRAGRGGGVARGVA